MKATKIVHQNLPERVTKAKEKPGKVSQHIGILPKGFHSNHPEQKENRLEESRDCPSSSKSLTQNRTKNLSIWLQEELIQMVHGIVPSSRKTIAKLAVEQVLERISGSSCEVVSKGWWLAQSVECARALERQFTEEWIRLRIHFEELVSCVHRHYTAKGLVFAEDAVEATFDKIRASGTDFLGVASLDSLKFHVKKKAGKMARRKFREDATDSDELNRACANNPFSSKEPKPYERSIASESKEKLVAASQHFSGSSKQKHIIVEALRRSQEFDFNKDSLYDTLSEIERASFNKGEAPWWDSDIARTKNAISKRASEIRKFMKEICKQTEFHN
jgi:hypothetical protein